MVSCLNGTNAHQAFGPRHHHHHHGAHEHGSHGCAGGHEHHHHHDAPPASGQSKRRRTSPSKVPSLAQVMCAVCLFSCCCLQAVFAQETLPVASVKSVSVLPATGHNYTFTLTSPMSPLHVQVSPCNGSVEWQLFAPDGSLLHEQEPPGHDHEVVHDSHEEAGGHDDHDDHGHETSNDEAHASPVTQYISPNNAAAGTYTLQVTGEGPAPALVQLWASTEDAFPFPSIKNTALAVHERTENSLEVEWTHTTSIAEDVRMYTIYATPEEEREEDHHTLGTVCALHYDRVAPVANTTSNMFQLTSLEANHAYVIEVVVTNMKTGYQSSYAALTASTSAHDHGVSTAESWGYAMLWLSINSIVSLSGGLLILFKKETAEKVLSDFVGLAVGTLLGSVFFILLPESSHIYDGVSTTTSGIVLAGLLFAYLMESTLHSHDHPGHKDGHADVHGVHSHVHDHSIPVEEKQVELVHTKEDGDAEDAADKHTSKAHLEHVTSQTHLTQHDHHHAHDHAPAADDDMDEEQDAMERAGVTKDGQSISAIEMKRRVNAAIISLVGDSIHNLVDGALIAAGFLDSVSSGTVVALAIIVHELPQEMGDFCILLNAGWSAKASLLANFCVSLTSFIGGAIALAVGSEHEDITNYAIPFASGLFLYLSLASLMPTLQHLEEKAYRRSVFFCAVGLLIIGLLMLWDGGSHDHGGAGHDDHAH